ncbi:MAG: hypothetical protein ACJ74Y_01620 [Bryobacteraceae bacterium]
MPALRITLAMKAGNHYDSHFFRDKEETIRKSPHASPPPSLIDHGEL